MYPSYFNQMYGQFNPRVQGSLQERFEVVPVTSIDEAKNAIINPTLTYLFLDSSNGNIYYKRMNNNGLSDFFVYSIIEQNKSKNSLDEINERLLNIEKSIGDLRDDKSISNAIKSQSVYEQQPSTDYESNENAESQSLQKGRGNDWRKKWSRAKGNCK